ncbi:hypothetical protein [Thalassotalea mangrovi]|uniref:Uncharacterized protein n=1 Tax=Thalassotalea mangrovi TaxID=2572245 RepID=A0A4U1BAT6_9GAMM|nr:hypothetical protein [Thalassotalea mangrovi]TKB47525.1 hypothetical protein E8M12_01705 [Thalassotalea mangrovi]
MKLKKLLQQEKQHILISPASYFLLLLLSLTGLLSCIIELTMIFQEQSPLFTLQITGFSSLIVSTFIFTLLFRANSDLLDQEIIEQEKPDSD